MCKRNLWRCIESCVIRAATSTDYQTGLPIGTGNIFWYRFPRRLTTELSSVSESRSKTIKSVTNIDIIDFPMGLDAVTVTFIVLTALSCFAGFNIHLDWNGSRSGCSSSFCRPEKNLGPQVTSKNWGMNVGLHLEEVFCSGYHPNQQAESSELCGIHVIQHRKSTVEFRKAQPYPVPITLKFDKFGFILLYWDPTAAQFTMVLQNNRGAYKRPSLFL